MYRRNFSSCQCSGSHLVTGLPFPVEVPRPGKYKVTVTLKTEVPLEKVSIYVGPGNLVFTGSIPAGIFRHSAVVTVGNLVPDGRELICQDRVVSVTVATQADCFSSLSVSEVSCPAIYIAGTGDASREPEDIYPKWGWTLSAYTNSRIAVSNHCRCGMTLESFRKKGLYAAINEYSRPGDFYFFHFDPTGQSIEDWKSGGRCRHLLARYCMECRERLAYPVLFAPAACRSREKADDFHSQLWEQCVDAYREVSKMTETPVIELQNLSVIPCDAYVMAGFIAREIARTCGAHPERGYRFLAKCMSV